MNRSSLTSRSAIGLCVLALAGCASDGPTTTADLMKGHANDTEDRVELQNQLAHDWETGRDLVADGRERVAEGEEQVKSARRAIERGQEEIERGQREIVEGRNLIAESERSFRAHFPDRAINPER